MIPSLIALGLFYAIGFVYTTHPWHTVLKIWLWGWLICGIGNFIWALISNLINLISKKDKNETNVPPKIKFTTEMVFALIESVWMLYWPSVLCGRLEESWETFSIRMGWREKPTERVVVKKENVKAVRETENTWQLEGESDLSAITIPNPPASNSATTVRLTHSNSYGLFEGVDFFVRVGDPDQHTGEFDLDSNNDWVKAFLVEELVCVDDEEMLRSEAEEPFEDEVPWEGTYEAELVIPAGRRSIEIKIVSKHPKLLASRVLADWEITIE